MVQNPALDDFERYLCELSHACRSHPAISGLVLMGSTAERWRVDEWSDHDFAIICEPGSQETLRGDLSWLPRYRTLCFAAREHHDGFKGVYEDGRVIEFAVVDREQLAMFSVNAYEVAYDDGGDLADLMRSIAIGSQRADPIDATRDFSVFLASILIGVGRARRGEILSASSVVRGQALDHLLNVFAALPHADARVDNLDARRRFEQLHPEIRLGTLLDSAVEAVARSLLLRAELLLGQRWDAYPAKDVAVVRTRLGWI